ncbi:MAG: TonB-dependent receptor plug domain-containing protein [Saprospiraceae bacterium]|nr:TonB-dependent receptor plug domain-containing protein [Saprospiraceae bacterium]
MLFQAKHYVLSLLIVFTFICHSFAQTFTLQGKVLDEQTNEPLTGATVLVETTSQGTTTNADGTFTIANISSNPIRISISYIGYETKQLEVDFRNKKSSNLSIKLASSSLELATIEVQGIATGQIKAFIEQKNAENIKHIISAAQILTFPDLNAAEVMQRIPGVTLQRDQGEGRYVQLRGTPPALTNFNINGEQVPSPEGSFRFVGMDIIPSDQIENVEVTKVLTPDMDADGIGGSVNIITKSASGEKPEITATMAAGYNHLRQSPNYNLQFAYGQRYKRLGFQINSSFFENNQGADNIEYKFGKGPFFNSTNQQQGVDNFLCSIANLNFAIMILSALELALVQH